MEHAHTAVPPLCPTGLLDLAAVGREALHGMLSSLREWHSIEDICRALRNSSIELNALPVFGEGRRLRDIALDVIHNLEDHW
jgi:hypothetical protein